MSINRHLYRDTVRAIDRALQDSGADGMTATEIADKTGLRKALILDQSITRRKPHPFRGRG